MSNTEAENIYAPPSTDVTVEESEKTTFLQHDGYSERGMFLCNEHFSPPKVCLKTGADILTDESAQKLCVVRYLPSIKTSNSVKSSWLLRVILLLCSAFFISNPLLAVLYLSLFLVIHNLLNHFSSEKVILNIHVDSSYLKRQSYAQIFFLLVAACASVFLVYQIFYFTDKKTIMIAIVTLMLSVKFALGVANTLKFVRKKGDYYYLKGAHPYFLAALPLRS